MPDNEMRKVAQEIYDLDPPVDDLEAFLTAARAQGRREGLEEAAKIAETTVYNERPGSKAIAAAIRSLLTKERE